MAGRRAKKALAAMLWHTLGRRNFVRLGRFLWMESRLDVPNAMEDNGELLVQSAVARHWAARKPVVIFDVGANVGRWSEQLFSELKKTRPTMAGVELHLFEPAPTCQQLLREAFACGDGSNDGASVHLHGLALSDRAGDGELNLFGETAGINSLLPHHHAETTKTVPVTCQTLDDFCEEQGVERIHLLKIDTEGNDSRVLHGAERMLAAGRIDWVQFEYNHRWVTFRAYLKDVFDLVSPHAYSVAKITPRGIEIYSAWHHELESFREGNYFLFRGSPPAELPQVKWWMQD